MARTKRTIKIKLNNFFQGIDSLKAENVLPLNTARICYNYAFKNGCLKNHIGFDRLRVLDANNDFKFIKLNFTQFSINTQFTNCFHYTFCDPNDAFKRKPKLILLDRQSRLYEVDINNKANGVVGTEYVYKEELGNIKSAINYRVDNRDVLLLCRTDATMLIYDASKTGNEKLIECVSAPKFLSMCVHYERLFVVENTNRTAIWFSQELNPLNWQVSLDGAGFIEMLDDRGLLTKVVSFNNYVYIFREYGISRLTAFADQAQFSVSHLFTSSGRIYENTIKLCGDRIMFMAEDGFYSFDGLTTRKISIDIENLFIKEKMSLMRAEYHNGNYYLACALNYDDNREIGLEKLFNLNLNSLLEINLKKSILTITRGLDILNMNVINETKFSSLVLSESNMFRTFYEINDEAGNFEANSQEKNWVSPKTDFGYAGKVKIIKQISLKTKTKTSIFICTEEDRFEVVFDGYANKQTINTIIKGKEFSFEIFNKESETNIESPEFVIDVVN